MEESLGSALTTLIPLALVVALSPLTVIPAVLVLHSSKPRPTSLAFLAGWVVGLVGLTVVFIEASSLAGGEQHTRPAWMSWVRIILGAALIVFGVYRFVTRHRHTEQPRWMRPFAKLTPGRAGLTGVAVAVVRPEVLALVATAGLEIGAGGLSTAGAWTCGVLFIAVAASTVAIPVLAYAIAGERLDPTMARIKDWMDRNLGAMEAVVLVVIGLMVIEKGISSLS
ncbi:GAP family protein [Smaragdicoccus niigatensis]|uniref:GAP family protein n=1 Tax=Smaragdicoccus niigatensis TaxID=359359 RepID=UPI00036368C1|nr:GAP family protein [Smaragdicoccus niigatensis]